ncbi:uncharacterized protein LOC105163998 [Sesamum indicum]|uniref:Uncharacterized protein LOC105163998 n=1 Tax=Sesamum indicum TaxID=4182 RepID=A0A6I9TB67_SESIN|nr:uncharacterized protein LOC105163998 [Sesamum indicum]
MKPSSPLSSVFFPSSCNAHETLSTSTNGRTSAGCIARVLRRILCFTSLPSCPFDHFKEDEKKKDGLLVKRAETPGIVARLMGLESIPGIDRIEQSPSANSSKKPRSPQVRRQRIIPTYQELEDDNFFILSFEHGGVDRHELSPVGQRKSRASSDRMKKKKSMRRRESPQEQDKENELRVLHVLPKENSDSVPKIRTGSDFQAENTRNVLRPLENSCQKSDISTTNKRTKQDYGLGTLISCETEGESENSSPNSVLEFVDFPTDIQETACSGNISRLANSKMRRTLSEELENCGKSNEKKLMNSDSRIWHRHQEKWDEIGKLAAMEMVESSWVHDEIRKSKHYYKEIGRDFASQILHRLLDELLFDLT